MYASCNEVRAPMVRTLKLARNGKPPMVSMLKLRTSSHSRPGTETISTGPSTTGKAVAFGRLVTRPMTNRAKKASKRNGRADEPRSRLRLLELRYTPETVSTLRSKTEVPLVNRCGVACDLSDSIINFPRFSWSSGSTNRTAGRSSHWVINPVRVATIGIPNSRPSNATKGPDSQRDGITSKSAARMYEIASSSAPTNVTRSLTEPETISSSLRNGPSPTITTWARSARSSSARATTLCSSVSTPFCRCSLATHTIKSRVPLRS